MKDNRIHDENEFLKDVAPVLFGEKPGLNSTPPKGYFDTFNSRLKARLDAMPGTSEDHKVIRLINFRNVAAAAVIALVIGVFALLKNRPAGSDYATLLWDDAAISIAADLLDDSDLVTALTLEEIRSLNVEHRHSADDLMDYLADEDPDDDY